MKCTICDMPDDHEAEDCPHGDGTDEGTFYASDADERAAAIYDRDEDLIREEMESGLRDRRGRIVDEGYWDPD